MAKWQKFSVSLFILALIGLQTVAILGPHDDWPFASNSMFAYYRTSDDPVYDLVILIENAAGEIRRLDTAADLGVPNTDAFRRLLFSRWYGSTDPRFPQGHHPDDTPDLFTARLTDFCQRVVIVMERRGETPAAIRLEIRRLEREGNTWVTHESKLIGRYQVSNLQFTLNPIG